MRFLVDTDVLTCLAQPNHAQHALVLDALAALAGRGDEACIVPQNVYEFWVVSTRPREQNGLGLDAAQVKAELARMTDLFRMVRDERAIYERWLGLVAGYEIRGKSAHDARLVAAMLRHGWTRLLTLNAADLGRYADIEAMTPQSVVGAPRRP